MNAVRYRCRIEGRRREVRAATDLNGIDYLEVVAADQRRLDVHFVNPLPGQSGGIPQAPPIGTANILIEAESGAPAIEVDAVGISGAGTNVLQVDVNDAGDYSTYTLRLVESGTALVPPDGFDPRLSAVEFSFKAGCPSEFDCGPSDPPPPPLGAEPAIDYLAKDYRSFRRLLLDRLSVLMPDWVERNPADVQIALVEVLAYVADHLSYYQDAVATEAYLGTARRRVSVRRHARLLDYRVHEGCNARAWVCLDIEPTTGSIAIPVGTPLLTRGSTGDVAVPTSGYDRALAERPVVFQTMHALEARAAHNTLRFYMWSDSECCLPAGCTEATFLHADGMVLEAGQVLVLKEVLGPTTGLAQDADPGHVHAVRLRRVESAKDPLDGEDVWNVEWHADDALPFDLCVTARVAPDGVPEVRTVSVALGNVVLADHGRMIESDALIPAAPVRGERYRPRLRTGAITFAVPYDDDAARDVATLLPATRSQQQEPRDALPEVWLDDGTRPWAARHDLLRSDRFAPDFVVEMADDGRAHLRFGDDALGRAPVAGIPLDAKYRVGNGVGGNVGADAICRIVLDADGVARVRNPMPAVGGAAPEALEDVRQFAPQAFWTQERAVTESDYVDLAEKDPEVQSAAARFRWTGSWYTTFVTIDRAGGRPVDASFERRIRSRLERFRIAGYDLEVDAPKFVALHVRMSVCAKPGYFRSDVKQSLLRAFGREVLSPERRGFFHPDNFTLSQPLYLSRLYETALAVEGVESITVDRFQRWGKDPRRELEEGVIRAADVEVLGLDNDPSHPQNGQLEIDVRGGL